MCRFLKSRLLFNKKYAFTSQQDNVVWASDKNNNTDAGHHNTLALVFHCKSRDRTRCFKPEHPSYKTVWSQTLSLFTEGEGKRERKAYVLIRFGHRVSILESQNQGQVILPPLPAYSFKSTSLVHPSAETMIASLIFGNSLNLSNPWFWNICTAAAAGLVD